MTNFIYDKSLIDVDFNFFLEMLPCAVGIKNQKGVYVGANNFTAKLTGFSHSKELIGITDADLRCGAVQLHELFLAQDQETVRGHQQSNLDIGRYANNDLQAFLSTKKPIIDQSGNRFILFTMTEIPIRALTHIFNNLSLDKMQVTELAGSFNISVLPKKCSGITLTAKEAECLFYLIRGKTAKEIAEFLNRSIRTIEGRIERLKNHFKCTSRSELIDKAFLLGFAQIIPPSLINGSSL